jgi:hypothetical protein
MASVTFEDVRKEFNGQPVVRDFSLSIPDREFLVLVARRAAASRRPCACWRGWRRRQRAVFTSATVQ